jgi:hypothetical protein
VEWPSGAITERNDLAVDRFHDIGEPMGTIPVQPSVSLGDNMTLNARGAGSIQWYLNGELLLGQTNRSLQLAGISAAQAGRYTVVITTDTVTNTYAAYVHVDAQFTRVTSGAIVEDTGNSYVPAWADYDGDGYADLFVANGGNEGPTLPFIYRNLGDGTFDRMTSVDVGDLADDTIQSAQGNWADVDNDGDLDLFVGCAMEHEVARLYLNDSKGRFVRATAGNGIERTFWNWGSAWADYDNDGWVDLYLASGWINPNYTDWLMHNQRSCTFDACPGVPFRLMYVNFGSWADADNDGDSDLFVGDFGSANNAFYRNNGDGTFIDDTSAGLGPGAGGAVAPVWGDFDNDGDLDLFLTRNQAPCYFYRNQGKGVFVASSSEPALQTMGLCAAAGDFDNDCDLDLFVTRGQGSGERSLLLRNDGTGHFESVVLGSFPMAQGHLTGCAWVDYDNNGALDLFATTVNNEANVLYRNNGNGNHWLILRLKGTTSNAAAIGAKVHIASNAEGRLYRQKREIAGGSFDDLRAHFGLGSAAVARFVNVEWPSGTRQTLRNVAADQIVTVVEPRRPIVSARVTTPTSIELTLEGDPEAVYEIQASTNLIDWTVLGTVTNTTGQSLWTDTEFNGTAWRFYRAVGTGL